MERATWPRVDATIRRLQLTDPEESVFYFLDAPRREEEEERELPGYVVALFRLEPGSPHHDERTSDN